MDPTEKLAPIRKGLLEFVILKIVAGDKVYVADMLKLLGPTEFATQEGTLYPLLSKLAARRAGGLRVAGVGCRPPRKYYKLTAKGRTQLSTLNDYWKDLNRTLAEFGN